MTSQHNDVMTSRCIKHLGLWRHYDRRGLNVKKRTTIYVDTVVWDQFMKYLIEKHGKTHGGVISEEIENAILLLVKKK